jgi:hypothetical protein
MSHEIDNPEGLLKRDPIDARYGSRKFLMCSYAIVQATVLLAYELIPPEIWLSATGLAVLGYVTANVGQDALLKWISSSSR